MLIALGLEGLVEWQHHRHLVHEARETIRHEIEANTQIASKDLQWLKEDEQRLQQNIQTLLLLRSGKKIQNGHLEYDETWDSPTDAAWQTAHSSGAMNYIDYADAQQMTDVYAQQSIVTNEGLAIYNAHSTAISPLFISGDPNAMSHDEVEISLQRSADLLLRVRSLEQILAELRQQYSEELKRMRS